MTYQEIKTFINTYIVRNGVNAITGAQLNTILNGLADYKGFDSVVVTTLPAGSDATGTVQGMTLVLGIPKGTDGRDGQDAVNPFKGWFTTDNIPTTGQEGDYCNVSDTSVTPRTVTIYRWNTTQNAFVDTGEVPDTASGDTFASSEELNQVAIDNSNLDNPVNPADPTKPVLAKAEDVMQLKAKLEGVTASETKADATDVDAGFINGNSGGIIGYNGPSRYVRIEIPQGTTSVRFLGFTRLSSWLFVPGYSFIHYSEGSVVVDSYYAFDVDSGNTTQIKEYRVDAIPSQSTHVRITLKYYQDDDADVMNSFYCYMQSGNNVGDALVVLTETNEIAKNNKAIFDTHSVIIKNLINIENLMSGGVYSNNVWRTNYPNGIISNELYLEDGVIYTVSNVNGYASGQSQQLGDSCIIHIQRFDSDGNPLNAVRPAGVITRTDQNPNKNTATATFKYEKHRNAETGEIDEAYCRIRLRFNANLGDSTYDDYLNAQVEIGDKQTALVGYNEVVDYYFDSLEDKNQNTKKEIKLLAIGDSLLSEAFFYAPIMMREMFPDINLVVGVAYEGYSESSNPPKGSLPAFLTYLTTYKNHNVSYFRYSSDANNWGSPIPTTMEQILTDKDWDVVVIRVNTGVGITTSGPVAIGENNTDVYVNGYEGNYDYNNIVDRLRDAIMRIVEKPVKFGGLIPQRKPTFNTTDTEASVLARMDADLARVCEVAEYYTEKSMFDFILPEGTAMQNARHIPEINVFGDLKDNGINPTGAGFLDYDDSARHLQDGIGKQICGYTVCLKMMEYEYKSIFGDKYPFNKDVVDGFSIPQKKGIPTGFKNHTEGESDEMGKTIDEYNQCLLRIMQKCVFMAIKNPYSVQTDMSAICAADISELNNLSAMIDES